MSKKAADTAASVGAVIAIEQHFPRDERLLDDGLAARLLPLGMKVFVWLLRFAWLRDWVCASTRSQSAPKRVEATGCGPNRANAVQEALDSWARREAEQQHVYRVWTL